jgi:hypothetical protein
MVSVLYDFVPESYRFPTPDWVSAASLIPRPRAPLGVGAHVRIRRMGKTGPEGITRGGGGWQNGERTGDVWELEEPG